MQRVLEDAQTQRCHLSLMTTEVSLVWMYLKNGGNNNSNNNNSNNNNNNNNKQQTTNNKQQTTNNKQQTTNNKQQTTNNKQQTTNNNNNNINNNNNKHRQQQGTTRNNKEQQATMHWEIYMHTSLCNHQWISVLKAHLTLTELWPTMTLWPKGTWLKVKQHILLAHQCSIINNLDDSEVKTLHMFGFV